MRKGLSKQASARRAGLLYVMCAQRSAAIQVQWVIVVRPLWGRDLAVGPGAAALQPVAALSQRDSKLAESVNKAERLLLLPLSASCPPPFPQE